MRIQPRRSPFTQLFIALLVVLGLAMSIMGGPVQASEATVTLASVTETGRTGVSTGLPLPRYASLKFKEANLRVGPGTKYAVSWSYRRKGLPVEIIQEFGNWRRIRDVDGTTGWVLHSLLSSRRTAIVAPWKRNFETKAGADLSNFALLNAKLDASADARTVARVQPGAQVVVERCQGGWCAVEKQGVKAWLPQEKLWGVYRGERVGG
jgi:SH3-like domain-containing protein